MPSTRRALCVGINNFKNYPGSALQGCVNDVADMQSLLTTYLGFTNSDITTLTDAQATKAAIMAQLKSMVEAAKAGKCNYLIFSLSSHGTQVPDHSGDEPDNADEAFCPYDLAEKNGEWDPEHVIVDDELHDLFIQLPATVLLECYFDTCHSGTGLRAVDLVADRKPRWMPPPSLDAFDKVDGRSSRGLSRSLLEKGMTHHILWAGCRADQTSADAHIDGKWHGAFTYYLAKNIRATQNDLSRTKLRTMLNADLKKNRYSQVAQMEANATTRKNRMG